MKVKTSDATGQILNFMAAKAAGMSVLNGSGGVIWTNFAAFTPTTNWAQGGPIIEREKINLRASGAGDWAASTHDLPHPERIVQHGEAPLIAACRCYVASKLGEEVDVPDELISD